MVLPDFCCWITERAGPKGPKRFPKFSLDSLTGSSEIHRLKKKMAAAVLINLIACVFRLYLCTKCSLRSCWIMVEVVYKNVDSILNGLGARTRITYIDYGRYELLSKSPSVKLWKGATKRERKNQSLFEFLQKLRPKFCGLGCVKNWKKILVSAYHKKAMRAGRVFLSFLSLFLKIV